MRLLPPPLSRHFSGAAPLLTALSFLTRLTPGRPISLEVLRASVRWYPVVGLVLGLLCTFPIRLAAVCGFTPQPWLTAWFYVALAFWLTRGLHWDGLADLGDAWGSNARGERFRQILRDSRLGAYGAMVLLLCFSLLLLTAQVHIAAGNLIPLLLAPVFGRCTAVLLAATTPPYDPDSLGGIACSGATFTAALYAAVGGLATALTLLPLSGALLLTVALCLLLQQLRALALTQGGCNGDFLGAAIVLGELLTLLAALV